MGVAVEQDDQQAGEDAENDDAIREDEPVAHHGHLMRHVAVSGQDRCQAWESVEAAIGGQNQNDHGRCLYKEVERACSECGACDLRDHSLIAFGYDSEVVGHGADADEHGPENRRHADHGKCGVLRFRLLERGDPVRDHLDAGERGTAGRKGAKQEKQRQRFCGRHAGERLDTCRMAEQNLEGADAEHGRDGCDEDIGRHGEELPRLADTSQVDDGHQKDCGDAESFTMGKERRNG